MESEGPRFFFDRGSLDGAAVGVFVLSPNSIGLTTKFDGNPC